MAASKQNLSFQAPTPLIEAITAATAATGQNRSEALREWVTAELTRRGHWPPTRHAEAA